MRILYNRLVTVRNERNVATIEYFMAGVMLEHLKELDQYSIGDMAKLCNVSKSTLSKFVRELGFDDFKDFRLEAAILRKKDTIVFSVREDGWF